MFTFKLEFVLYGVVTSSQQNSSLNVNIGQRPGSPGTFNFSGKIDDVRIYQRALTQAEIQADQGSPVTPTTPTPSTSVETFVAQAAGPVQMTTGPNGDLFYVDLNGTIRRIKYSGANQAP